MTNTKKCSKCGEEKSLDLFGKRNRGKYFRSSCRSCDALFAKDYARRNPHTIRKNNLSFRYRIYGINEDIFKEMIESQKGVCNICGVDIYKNGFIDHNHNNFMVRDVLCPKCNVLIGMANESKEILLKAIDYLDKWSRNNSMIYVPEKYRERLAYRRRKQ